MSDANVGKVRTFHTGEAVRRRLLVAAALGAGAGAAVAFIGPWQLAVLVGWDVAALFLSVWTWRVLARANGAATRAAARVEDTGRSVERLVVVSAGVVSLVGVVLGITKANELDGSAAGLLISVAVLTVAASWVLIQTSFTVRYADLYYAPPEGGVDWSCDEAPDFVDFAYLAFTIGMTFQVSDTSIGNRALRRSALGHALLSYVFGTMIVALTINLLAGIVK